MIDKNQAMIDWLVQCPAIKSNPLFFNCIIAKDDNKQIITMSNDKNIQKPYIDGSILKQYKLSLIDFKSISANAVVRFIGTGTGTSYSNENVEEMLRVQDIIDWVERQNDIRNFPDFGSDCVIDEVEPTSENPVLSEIDASVAPALAKYSVTIKVTYIDYSKSIYNMSTN